MKLTENLTTEFKRIYTEDIKKTVVAFANTNGGKIFIGIEDDGNVIGIDDVDETMLKRRMPFVIPSNRMSLCFQTVLLK